MTNYLWCIGGGLLQIPVINEANNLGLKVIVTDNSENCICSKHADIFYKIDIFDIEGHINLASTIKNKFNIIGVLAAGIDAPITMSKLCEYLNLPGVSSKISEIVHNKNKFREFAKSNKIPTPKFQLCNENNLKDLDEILKKFKLPFIIKNVDSSGSRGTKIFYERDLQEELKIAKEAIAVSKNNSFLVESVWKGLECTVETLFDICGVFHECFITDRHFNYSSGYPIETGLVSPSRLPKNIQKDCYKLAKDVSSKLGINIGAAKFDMIITEQGPRIIEMTTRLSGGFDCQYVVPASSGKNIIKAAIMTSCGMKFPDDLLISKFDKTCVTGSHWPKNGIFKKIYYLEEINSIKGLEHIFFRKKEGDKIQNYYNCTDRIDFLICTGINYEDAKRNLENALSKIVIEISDE